MNSRTVTTIVDNDETQAEKLLARGKVDQALAAYQRIKPISTRILNIIGRIYTEKKNDQEAALKYHSQALLLQETVRIYTKNNSHMFFISIFV